MDVLGVVLKLAMDAAPKHPGFQIFPMYVFLNLACPVLLGIILSWITKPIEKGLSRLMGERR